jgi:OmcA/MtrC family decaheme c-type cytochrome
MMSKRQIRYWLGAALIGFLTACGGGGGGDRAVGVEPGPAAPNQPVDPPAPIQPGPAGYFDAEEIVAYITSATIDESASAFAVVNFQLTDGNGTAIIDLPRDEVRFVLAKLQTSPLGAGTGSWQSYVNRIETADTGIGPGTEDKLHATYERDDEDGVSERDGTLENFGDGTYRYTFATDLDALPADILAQAATEGLDLSYDPTLTHRVAMQFDGAANPQNPFFDWVPATGDTTGIATMQISLTDNCNRCHNPLGIHGGNRVEIEYCVVCHNPGSTDANSGNTVDMKVMIHKIHYGENLTNLPYIIWGFRNGEHDYSDIVYPQDPRNCQNCHVGSATTNDFYPEVALSSQGDNWNEYPTRAACGSCHDDVDWLSHRGGQTDDSRCGSCHAPTSGIGALAAHEILERTESQNYLPVIESITNTGQGEFPSIDFRITNPSDGSDWDILNDAPWTVGGGASRLAVDVAWDTGDYNNTGNEDPEASAVSIDALATATPNGDGSFNVVSPVAIPDGTLAPNIPANGSGGVVVEGHPAVEVEAGEGEARIFMQNVNDFFSINEADGTPVPRRDAVELTECLDCHQDLVLHGNNRANNIQSCVTCHNPRNTDREVRTVAANPPTDGKDEESINFSNMVHAIHAPPPVRTNALQVVGFRGFTTYVYDSEHVQFPGNLADCRECHGDDGYQLPLPSTVLGTTIDTGADVNSPADDVVISPASNACYSCHENDVAKAHMEQNGGSFSASQADLDDGTVVEQCELCHGSGRSADVELVHGLLD